MDPTILAWETGNYKALSSFQITLLTNRRFFFLPLLGNELGGYIGSEG